MNGKFCPHCGAAVERSGYLPRFSADQSGQLTIIGVDAEYQCTSQKCGHTLVFRKGTEVLNVVPAADDVGPSHR